jgi:hypothetical protein
VEYLAADNFTREIYLQPDDGTLYDYCAEAPPRSIACTVKICFMLYP